MGWGRLGRNASPRAWAGGGGACLLWTEDCAAVCWSWLAGRAAPLWPGQLLCQILAVGAAWGRGAPQSRGKDLWLLARGATVRACAFKKRMGQKCGGCGCMTCLWHSWVSCRVGRKAASVAGAGWSQGDHRISVGGDGAQVPREHRVSPPPRNECWVLPLSLSVFPKFCMPTCPSHELLLCSVEAQGVYEGPEVAFLLPACVHAALN